MQDVAQRVKEIMVEKLAVYLESVTPETNIKEELGADSLDVIELVMAFEDEFKITIPDEAAESIVTVQQAIDMVVDRAGNRK